MVDPPRARWLSALLFLFFPAVVTTLFLVVPFLLLLVLLRSRRTPLQGSRLRLRLRWWRRDGPLRWPFQRPRLRLRLRWRRRIRPLQRTRLLILRRHLLRPRRLRIARRCELPVRRGLLLLNRRSRPVHLALRGRRSRVPHLLNRRAIQWTARIGLHRRMLMFKRHRSRRRDRKSTRLNSSHVEI